MLLLAALLSHKIKALNGRRVTSGNEKTYDAPIGHCRRTEYTPDARGQLLLTAVSE
jgi:hypothetical protein